jgi:long-chain fatty acid transport protein
LPAWDIALRAGYLYSMTPVPDKNFNPAFSDANGHVLSTGIGLTCRSGGKFLGLFNCGKPEAAAAERKFIGLDFAYQLFLYEPRAVNGNAFPPVNGKYTTVNHTLALTFRVNY